MFTLYATPLSANARKPLALVAHLGLAPEIRRVNVYAGEGRTSEYRTVHPLGKVPALVDGDLVLWESNAILTYITEAYGDFRLWSRDPVERADIARWLFWESAHWQPALTRILSAPVGHALLPDVVPAPTSDPDWEDPAAEPLFAFLEAHLARHPYLAVDALSLADFSVAGMTTYFRFAGFPFERYPALRTWHERIEGLEAWQRSATSLWSPDSWPENPSGSLGRRSADPMLGSRS